MRKILYILSFVFSIFLSRKNGQGYIFSGLLFGAIITTVIFVLSLIYPNSTNNTVIWILLVPVTTILGSLLGMKRQGKPKRHKLRR